MSTISLPCPASYCWSENFTKIFYLTFPPSVLHYFGNALHVKCLHSDKLHLFCGILLHHIFRWRSPLPQVNLSQTPFSFFELDRWKQPDLERPIKVNIVLPVVFFIVCSFLILMPIFEEPEVGRDENSIKSSFKGEYFAKLADAQQNPDIHFNNQVVGIGLALIFSGVPVYLLFIYWTNRFWFITFSPDDSTQSSCSKPSYSQASLDKLLRPTTGYDNSETLLRCPRR